MSVGFELDVADLMLLAGGCDPLAGEDSGAPLETRNANLLG